MMKKISLKDIANQVGVSTALVSYVLNNQKEGRINKDVAQRIKETAKRLNYRTNQVAKSLKTNKTFTIGLIVADISNPFFSSLARIIEDEADKNNYTVIFGSSDENPNKSEKLIETLVNRQVDGLIIAPPQNSEAQIEYLVAQDIPFVLIDRYFPGIETNFVAIDNYKAAYTAVQHFIDIGRKSIGMVTYESSIFNLNERTRGYLAAMEENKIPFKENWLKELRPDNTKRCIERAINELVGGPQPIDALLFSSNTIAAWGLKWLNSIDVKVPDQLAVISFDESEALDLFYAPLTYIKQPLQEMGQAAIKILLDNIMKSHKPVQVNMEAGLVIRESTRVQTELN
jgi:LacI family transcriptional regulator